MAANDSGSPQKQSPDTGAMDKRKRTYASNAALYTVFAVGALVLLNLIGTRVFGRLDLTQNHVYTLSPASKDVVRNLPDYLTVKAYISKDLPPELASVSRYVRDLLDEYRASSKNKLRFEAYDPGSDKKVEEEAGACKVGKMQIQVLRSQKFEVGTYYLGLCFHYAGKDEAIPEISQSEGLEYQVSSLVKRMTQKKRKVAFTTGHGEQDLNQGFTFLKHVLEQEFDTATVNPSSAAIGDDVDALVVGGPKQPFDDKGRHEIDSFLMKGKGVVFLVDGMAMNAPRGMQGMPEMGGQPKIGQANDAGLGEILEKYGFKVNQDFVLDKQNVPGPIEIQGRKMLANVPMFVGVKTDDVSDKDKDFTVLAGVNAIVFPYSSSVDLVGPLAGGKAPAQGRLWTLARSSEHSWRQSGFFFFSPTTKIEEGKDQSSAGMAYAYQGPLHSAYAPATAGMSSPDAPPADSKKPVRLVMVGDSDFASDEYMQMARFLPIYQGGAQMLFNAISWTVEDEALTPVRSKTVGARPITLESDKTVAVAKTVNIAGVPLAFIGFGLLRWRVRRARRQGQKL
jgi:gliding-associated putative ABC transporter substrate-binding component GldG